MEEKKGFFGKLVSGLTKTRNSIVSGLDSIFSGFSHIDDDFYEELEEILIMSDIGVNTTMEIIEKLKEQVKELKIKEPEDCKELLIKNIEEQMDLGENAYDFENEKSVVMVIGVNGVGKTTSIGKLAAQLKGNGKKVVMAAADTFRAAAADQLKEWARRSNVDIVAGNEGSDPGAVLFDAIASAKNKNDFFIILIIKMILQNYEKYGRIQIPNCGYQFPQIHLASCTSSYQAARAKKSLSNPYTQLIYDRAGY